MVVSFITDKPETIIHNFQILGAGSIFDENNCVFTQGTFTGGKINGQGTITKYGSIEANIRRGEYTNGVENGKIFEYSFSKQCWANMLAGHDITSAKYTHMFTNGSWTSTLAQESRQIRGSVAKNAKGYVIAFEFTEL